MYLEVSTLCRSNSISGFLEEGEECEIGFRCIFLTGNRIVQIWFFNFLEQKYGLRSNSTIIGNYTLRRREIKRRLLILKKKTNCYEDAQTVFKVVFFNFI